MDKATKENLIKWPIILGILFLIALSLKNWWHQSIWQQSGYRPVMGTSAQIVAVAPKTRIAQAAIEKAFEEITRIESIMSAHMENSELTHVNNSAFSEPIQISTELFELIQHSIQISKNTQDAFDITVGPMIQLWKEAGKKGQKPTHEEIETTRSKTGWQKLILDKQNQSIMFNTEGMKLDLGGIAKGYAIDRAVAVMRENGATGGMIEIGGDVRCFGDPPSGSKTWQIGLQDPTHDENLLLVLHLLDKAVATSGDYRRFVYINDEKISHIINPSFGQPKSDLTSVSVIANTATEADAYATAVTVMGHEKGLIFLESQQQLEGIIIPANQVDQIKMTSGTNTFIKQ